MPKRVFLDWEIPLLSSIADQILPHAGTGPLDLKELLILSPTRQAGRRLREYLALAWRQRGGTAILSMQVSPPSVLLQPENPTTVAHPFDWMPAWQQTLLEVPPDSLPHLFPIQEERFTPQTAMDFGVRIQKLREELLDAGLDLSSVANRNPMVSEQARWQDLAKLETAYRERLAEQNLTDPTDAKRAAIQTYRPPPQVKRLILAGVPDPSPVIIRRLTELDTQADLHIECWIHAPASEASLFDEWGRPTTAWRNRNLGRSPQPDGWIEQAADPFELASRVADLVSESPPTPDLAFGLLHDNIASPVRHALEEIGRNLYIPNPVSLAESPTLRLLNVLQDHRIHNDPESLRTLWRQPDLLHACGVTQAEELLKKWDEYASEHLPVSSAAVSETLTDPELKQAWEKMLSFLDTTTPSGLLTGLQAAYAEKELDPSLPRNRYRQRQYTAIADTLQEAARREKNGSPPSISLLLQILAQQSIDPLRVEDALTAEGWLELAYHPGSRLLLLGMQEGTVPPALTTDPFLPNSLRQELGLKSDRDWIARDAYLFHTLLMSRKPEHVRILTLKRDAEGNPLLPSRYLFACPKAEMLKRADLLFQETPPPPLQPAPVEGLSLHPDRVTPRIPESLSVSAINQYLACPTRFYFQNILDMRGLDDTQTTPDAASFGSLVHGVLEELVTADPSGIDTWNQLAEEVLERRITALLGSERGLPIRVMAQSALARIASAAHPHFTLRDDGWKTVEKEKKMSRVCQGITIKGIADRIDEHPEKGFLLIDYKTSDTAKAPASTHLGAAKPDREYLHVEVKGKTRQWTNLQLPLYRWLATPELLSAKEVPLQVAYLNLPKAVSKTELVSWDAEPQLAKDAESCLENVIRKIQNQEWTPTQKGTTYDDFTALLHHGSDWIL